jgi:phage host-nuclease inhibitor protein Gam
MKKGGKMKNDIVERFISWRIRGVNVSEKRLKQLLKADVGPAASDKVLDGLYKMISATLKDISNMQNEIITLQTIMDDSKSE